MNTTTRILIKHWEASKIIKQMRQLEEKILLVEKEKLDLEFENVKIQDEIKEDRLEGIKFFQMLEKDFRLGQMEAKYQDIVKRYQEKCIEQDRCLKEVQKMSQNALLLPMGLKLDESSLASKIPLLL